MSKPETPKKDVQPAEVAQSAAALASAADKAVKKVKAMAKTTTPPKGSTVLKERLGLDGYRLESVKLVEPITVQGCCKVPKAIFAKSIIGDDRVLLHIETVTETGKRRIISALKKLTPEEWDALCAALVELKIKWREKKS